MHYISNMQLTIINGIRNISSKHYVVCSTGSYTATINNCTSLIELKRLPTLMHWKRLRVSTYIHIATAAQCIVIVLTSACRDNDIVLLNCI